MTYTGIGSRETPEEIRGAMYAMAQFMARKGHTLRSGGARGADSAFKQGCDAVDGTKEVYLPFSGFAGNQSEFHNVTKEARLIAREFHPRWDNLGNLGRDFMGRNCYQLLGLDFKTPTEFILCWTKEGRVTGGTGQALRMAEHYLIPVFNLGSMSLDEANDGITEILKGTK